MYSYRKCAKKGIPKPVEGDYVINNFTFKSGENLEQQTTLYNHRNLLKIKKTG
jgi:hypothetical protein